MTAKEQKLGYDSGSVSTLDKVKRFASRNASYCQSRLLLS